ncbi:NAD(P)-binding protein [Didymella exigua CBS 183.55]|uniref:NAD(P)-binding protein n=1 Tax=Didymella exigua CBS 183.55 TaxID=1150837 RepID=A0A6A5RZI0_9PLEO|nr:NAD(P)-binding protein [Didymella exigua CBS 183.55]KAF1933013.1 NAD(P)-binding protein [Didymella exigua CBS 183.55]
MSKSLTVVVTGSNRGIGQGIIHLLVKTHHTSPLTIIATSRNGNDLGIEVSPPSSIQYAKLDISSSSSITSFFQSTPNIDVVINNAGVNNNNNETPELAAQTISVNYKGTRDVCAAALSTTNGRLSRIVNVSSTACQLNNYDQSTQNKFRTVQSVQDVNALADTYIGAVRAGGAAQEQAGFGSPPMSYQVSKALINALTVVLARENPDVLVNCCCPGWVDTDMGHQVGRPPKTLEEGARIPVRLAVGEVEGGGDGDGGLGRKGGERVSGRYFANEGVKDRGWGRARAW